MQIYSSAISPFGARVTIAARAKGIGLETLTLPPEWRQSPEIRALNPIVKIPILLADGMTLPESETILRYLEDRFPEPSLLPATAERRARMNLLIRIADLYVSTPVIRLFPHLDPAQRDARVIEAEVAHWRNGLANLAFFMAELPEPTGMDLTLADCVLGPTFQLCDLIAGSLELGDMLASHNSITAYYGRMLGHPVAGPVLVELIENQRQRFGPVHISR